MKIGFDIGGVISKYPAIFTELIGRFNGDEIYIISDMHPRDKIIETLQKNGFAWICSDNIYSANYEKHGNMAKAVLIRYLQLDIFIDDFDGYLQWDSSLGPQPLLLKVQPDGFKPYWHDEWKCDGGDFGRRCYKKD